MHHDSSTFMDVLRVFIFGIAGLPEDEYEKNLATALERERLDPIPRTDLDKLLRRQLP